MASNALDKYEIVIGLEVHAQLQTLSKMYAADSTEYGLLPNTNVSVITLAHPGTLPKLNKQAIEFAIRMGLACDMEITKYNLFDRKSYYYPDLPKGYQVTQDKTPICRNGHVMITSNNVEKRINITRIHMEEDAGKSIHFDQEVDTLVDYNRAGVGLIEIVSEPDMRSGEEAYNYLTEIRRLVRYLDICDGNMEEGSLRCDANISIRLKGTSKFGTRVEIKNMNSIRNVQRAIDYEAARHAELLEKGGKVLAETRMFDAATGQTHAMRMKESMNDYRYFPEPDLQPLIVTEEFIAEVKAKLPSLPRALRLKFVNEYGLPEYDAAVLTDTKEVALYFEALCQLTQNYKAASNWVMGPVKSFMNERAIRINDLPFTLQHLADLIALIDSRQISFSVADNLLLPALANAPHQSAKELAVTMNLIQSSDNSLISSLIDQTIAEFPDKVKEYKNGKKGIAGMIMGIVMKKSSTKLDPKLANELVIKKLDEAALLA
ncbi:MAG: Asp-tRNA(Asn)/Glu-tRNA(Gln) amidotransferase subunit GatB [Cytophagales bacterium]|nr:MAG: Asp-tRNA(Asn)/Glu-tRNA(Gln) amidotransferase subunit GatB [Cytophagales bacterium]